MQTTPVTPADLARSVIAVPPLARDDHLTLSPAENQRMVEYLESGGISTVLYGGNAILYHVAPSEYDELLAMLVEIAGKNTLVIPSVGPAFGVVCDQAEVLKDYEFPTVMMLPQQEMATSSGIATAVRYLAETIERPVVLYIKHDRYLDVASVRRLMADQLLSAIKYAVVRDDPAKDDYLRELCDAVGTDRIVSGIGEQPAIVHMRDFALQGFTSGCVCLAPRLSMQMLRAISQGDLTTAENLRERFQPLENLRNAIHPVRVLHFAVAAAGVCQTGPILPLLSELPSDQADAVGEAATALAQLND